MITGGNTRLHGIREANPRSMAPQRLRLIAVPLILGSLLVGCGGQTGPGPFGSGSGASPAASQPAAASGTATMDVCALLTGDEVASHVGTAVSRVEASGTLCTWWLGDDGDWIGLVAHPDGRALFEAAAPDGQPEAGLGDKAFSDGDMLVALKGETMLQLSSEIISSNADPNAFSRPLMELALARL